MKSQQLKQLFQKMQKAKLPLSDQSPIIPGEGNPDSGIVLIGEAGGANEARLLRPFVGQAGALLDRTLIANSLNRNKVWITNVIKARPPENRDPTPAEIAEYRPYLEQELQIINPWLVVALGRFAMNWFMPDLMISRAHGKSFKLTEDRTLFPVYHPAAALRAEAMKQSFQADIKELTELIKELHPEILKA